MFGSDGDQESDKFSVQATNVQLDGHGALCDGSCSYGTSVDGTDVGFAGG